MQHFKKSVAIELLTRKEENCVSEFRNNIRWIRSKDSLPSAGKTDFLIQFFQYNFFLTDVLLNNCEGFRGSSMEVPWTGKRSYTQCGPKVLGLMFLKIEDTWERNITFLFKTSSIGIYTQAFARSYSFWKAAVNSSFWTLFNSSVTASWISATSAKWSPF
jgi:hypothetical protein